MPEPLSPPLTVRLTPSQLATLDQLVQDTPAIENRSQAVRYLIDQRLPHSKSAEMQRERDVAFADALAVLEVLGVPQLPQLLARFRAGEVIAGTDPAVLALHANATACRSQLAAAAGVSPGKLATGTLRALLEAIGWRLVSAGRIKARGEARDAMAYRAEPFRP